MFWVKQAVLLLLLCGLAQAQSNPGFIQGAVLCADTGCSDQQPASPLGLNQAFMTKQDVGGPSSGLKITGPGPASQDGYTLYLPTGTVCPNCGGLLVAGTSAGGLSGGQMGNFYWNDLSFNDGVALTNAQAVMVGMHVGDFMNSPNARGFRTVIWGDGNQSVKPSDGLVGFDSNYVGVYGSFITTTGIGGTSTNPLGGIFGMNGLCGNNQINLWLDICTGGEFDNVGVVNAGGTSTQKYKFGINIVDGNPGPGAVWDAAIAVYKFQSGAPADAPGRGWECGFCVGEAASTGLQPMSGSLASTIIGLHTETLSAVNVGYGIDFRKLFCTQAYAAYGTVSILDCTGNLTLAGGVVAKTIDLFGPPLTTITTGQISVGSTTVAPGTGNCPTTTVLPGLQGCWELQVGATLRYVPFY